MDLARLGIAAETTRNKWLFEFPDFQGFRFSRRVLTLPLRQMTRWTSSLSHFTQQKDQLMDCITADILTVMKTQRKQYKL